MNNRRARFREYMRRLDVSGNAREAIETGLYVTRSGRSVADDLAARLEINPASTHVVLGGVGSGKSTELMLACDRLNQHDDTSAVYIDISEHGDLRSIGSLGDIIVSELYAHARYIGENSDVLDQEVLESCHQWMGGNYTYDSSADIVSSLYQELAKLTPHVIVIIDSLDRMSDTEHFTTLVDSVFQPLRDNGIGLVVTGPMHLLYSTARPFLDRFDRLHHVPVVNVSADDEGVEFLVRVLRARVPDDVCPVSICRRLAELSGGVLRDLIALTQSAVEEAYTGGVDTVEDHHVAVAADVFGRKQLLGLDPPALDVLQRVRKSGRFWQTSDRDIALLLTRRVLEYQEVRGPRYTVHPTLAPLLEQMEAP